MSSITHIPPSIPIILKRIEHYTNLEEEVDCDTQKLCYSLVITELELIMEELTETI